MVGIFDHDHRGIGERRGDRLDELGWAEPVSGPGKKQLRRPDAFQVIGRARLGLADRHQRVPVVDETGGRPAFVTSQVGANATAHRLAGQDDPFATLGECIGCCAVHLEQGGEAIWRLPSRLGVAIVEGHHAQPFRSKPVRNRLHPWVILAGTGAVGEQHPDRPGIAAHDSGDGASVVSDLHGASLPDDAHRRPRHGRGPR